jgi:hypothetical protein
MTNAEKWKEPARSMHSRNFQNLCSITNLTDTIKIAIAMQLRKGLSIKRYIPNHGKKYIKVKYPLSLQ